MTITDTTVNTCEKEHEKIVFFGHGKECPLCTRLKLTRGTGRKWEKVEGDTLDTIVIVETMHSFYRIENGEVWQSKKVDT